MGRDCGACRSVSEYQKTQMPCGPMFLVSVLSRCTEHLLEASLTGAALVLPAVKRSCHAYSVVLHGQKADLHSSSNF
eukprot:SAG31_NODE_1722_length_7452_cov_2.771658_7_plen_77_part_00